MLRPTICRYGVDPFRELRGLQRDMNRFFSHTVGSSTVPEFPAINAWSSGDQLVITAELPGIDPENLSISIQNDILSIAGHRNLETLKEGEVYHRQERSHGQFSRILKLPYGVDGERVRASYKRGILTITLNRKEEEKPRKITIKSE